MTGGEGVDSGVGVGVGVCVGVGVGVGDGVGVGVGVDNEDGLGTPPELGLEISYAPTLMTAYLSLPSE